MYHNNKKACYLNFILPNENDILRSDEFVKSILSFHLPKFFFNFIHMFKFIDDL